MTTQASENLDCILGEGAHLQVRRCKPFIFVISRGEPGSPTSAVLALVGVNFSPEEAAVPFVATTFRACSPAPAQLVTVCQRLATSASESGRNRLTFLPPFGQILDGHEWSMAGTYWASSCHSGDGRGV
jgi:hypothetical protein